RSSRSVRSGAKAKESTGRSRLPLPAESPALVRRAHNWIPMPTAATDPISEADGQTRVVLREASRAGLARGDPVQLGELQLFVERVLTLVQHCGHPPREVGAPPDAS